MLKLPGSLFSTTTSSSREFAFLLRANVGFFDNGGGDATGAGIFYDFMMNPAGFWPSTYTSRRVAAPSSFRRREASVQPRKPSRYSWGAFIRGLLPSALARASPRRTLAWASPGPRPASPFTQIFTTNFVDRIRRQPLTPVVQLSRSAGLGALGSTQAMIQSPSSRVDWAYSTAKAH